MAIGNQPNTIQSGTMRPVRACNSPPYAVKFVVMKKFFQNKASVHCGMIYGKMKIAPMNFLNGMVVRVIRNAITPPKRMEKTQAKTETSKLLPNGSQKFPTASSELKRIDHQ